MQCNWCREGPHHSDESQNPRSKCHDDSVSACKTLWWFARSFIRQVIWCRADPSVVAQRLQDLGLRFERYDNVRLMSKMAFGMFATRKSHKCAPVGCLAPTSYSCTRLCKSLPVQHRTQCPQHEYVQELIKCSYHRAASSGFRVGTHVISDLEEALG